MSLNKIPGIKVSRIYKLPTIRKRHNFGRKRHSQYYLPHSAAAVQTANHYSNKIIQPKENHDNLVKQGQFLLNSKIVHLFNGNYKKYKASSVEYSKFAVNNFEITKELKQPTITFHWLNPLNIFYWARMGRVLILDALRTKTPEEILHRKLGQAEKMKVNKEKEIINILTGKNIDNG